MKGITVNQHLVSGATEFVKLLPPPPPPLSHTNCLIYSLILARKFEVVVHINRIAAFSVGHTSTRSSLCFTLR